jgi:hypothetical protein
MAIAGYLLGILKSETFWVSVQSLVAGIGLIFLIRYTRYTRRMMELQLETRRSETAPVLTLSCLSGSAGAVSISNERPNPPRNLHLKVRNIGKGPALRFKAWYRPVDENFRLQDFRLLARSLNDLDGVSTSFEVLPNEPAEIAFQGIDPTRHSLCVLECEDTGGQKHQFQLIHLPRPAAIDPWFMVHGWSSLS